MASQQLRIQMTGGAPFGFRLLGGDKTPLTVAKIRPSSKAQMAGLLEGDVILAINNVCSKGLSHATATALTEARIATLTLLILRGKGALGETESVIASLGAEIQRLNDTEASAVAQQLSANQPAFGVSNDLVMNGRRPEVTFRLDAPPSGVSLKQRRESRNEAASPVVQSVDVVGPAQSSDKPSYYTRQEQTSTDGGKTTRTVEEVRTERVGGTTLTKVTKQEFTSYSSSSRDPQTTLNQPKYSIITNEETERPVHLETSPAGQWVTEPHDQYFRGFPSRDDGGIERRDDRSWSTSTSVERKSVKTQQPFDTAVRSLHQAPSSRNWTDAQDAGGDGSNRFQQGIPAIEIQFQPSTDAQDGNVTGTYRLEDGGTNFQVKIGSDVSFQPKVTAYKTPTGTEIRVESQPVVRLSHSHQGPGVIRVEAPAYSNPAGNDAELGHTSHRVAYPQSGHGYAPRPDYETPTPRNLGHSEATQFGGGINRPLNDKFEPENHVQAGSNPWNANVPNAGISQHTGKPDLQNKPYDINNRPGFISEQHDTTNHPQFGNKPVPQPHLGAKPQFGYNPQSNNDPANHPHSPTRYGVNPQPGLNTEPQHKSGYYPDVGYHSEPQNKPSLKSDFGYNQPGQTSQFDYNTEPPQNEREYHPRSGYNIESQKKPGLGPQFGYDVEPQDKPGYGPQSDYSIESRSRPGYPTQFGYDREPQNRPGHNAQLAYNPETYNTEGVQPQSRPLDKGHFSEEYSNRDSSLPRAPGDFSANQTNQWMASPLNADRDERAVVVPPPKWIAGSKLPMAHPASSRSQAPTEEFAGWNENAPQQGQTGWVHDQPEGSGWFEPKVGVVKSGPSVALSRVYEPNNRPVQSWNYVDPLAENPESTANYPYVQPTIADDQSRSFGAQQVGHPVTRVPERSAPSAGNVWRPSSYVEPGFRPEVDGYGEKYAETSNGVMYGNDPRYQTQSHPSALPLGSYSHGAPAPKGHPQFQQAPAPAPQAPPPPPPPPPAPPIDHLKIYRGDASSADRSFGQTTLEQRVKMANSVAHSVLSPENKNSRGQKLFLRRRENAHKWTKHGPDPVPEAEPPSSAGTGYQHNPNLWSPSIQPLARPGPPTAGPYAAPLPPSPASAPQPVAYPDVEQPPGGGKPSYSLADDVALSGKGGRLFAKKKANADKWASAESTGRQAAPSVNRQTGYGQNDGLNPSSAAAAAAAPGQPVTNRLQEMIRQKPSTEPWKTTVHQTSVQLLNPLASTQDGLSRGLSYNSGSSSSVPQPNAGYRQVRFQGISEFSPSPTAPPSVQTSRNTPGLKIAPKQYGAKLLVSQGQGYTDL